MFSLPQRSLTDAAVSRLLSVQKITVPHHSYNVLLHLCTGGNQPDGLLKRVLPQQAEEVSDGVEGGAC